MKRPLRPYQTTAIDRLRASLRAGHRRPMLMLPTGGGKTMIAAAIVEMARAKGNRIVFAVPALELIDQTVSAFEAEGITDIGVMQAMHPRTDPEAPVQVVSIPTLARRELPDTDIVLVDEAHVLAEVIKRWMKAKPRLIFIGLSATPWTKNLGKHFDDLVIAATIGSLIEQRFLSMYWAFAPKRPDLTGVRVIAGDYDVHDLSVAMNQPHLTDLVVREWVERAKGLPTLCFGVDRAHAQALAAEFKRAGVRTAYVDGDTPRKERDRIKAGFHSGKIEVVCNIGVLTTGIDWDVRCIVLARPTKSDALLAQIVGRALRTAEGKHHALLIDLSGSFEDLGLPEHLGTAELHGTPGREPKAKVRNLPIPCPDCSRLRGQKSRKCGSCGHVYPVPTPADRLKLAEYRLMQSERSPRRRVWTGLLWWADQHRLSRRWALANFHGLFNDWPTGLGDRPAAPDSDVREWIEAERAAWQWQKRKEETAA
ncbi:DEAD/DEAH box helicase [Devosia sp. Root635]|uniref:DEAD/DEAH box helicase n=1 Tax=Devosia sp. Root635 TaxID=1736575 RepID=UPI0006F9CAC2|nr:DEAD/DEAH box helicase [Devosia sp. Root635]KRA42113.1 hypothetical protein ASD80_10330 [Devosia sp. Root635]